MFIIKTVSRLVLSIQAYYRLTHDVFLISFLFRFVCNENQFQLPLFMINKVNATIL